MLDKPRRTRRVKAKAKTYENPGRPAGISYSNQVEICGFGSTSKVPKVLYGDGTNGALNIKGVRIA